MRYTPAEKYETILMVEDSSMSVKRTLKELDIARSTFYKWYNDYLVDGYDGLEDSCRGTAMLFTIPIEP